MYLPLTRKLPLRDSTAWGRFASIQAIPRIYGCATIAPVPYDDSGRLFVAADHASKGVVSVISEGVPITSYRTFHQQDSAGKTVTFVELQNPVVIETASLSIAVEGLMHPITGRLMTNPADVAWDIVQWATGKAVDRNTFAMFAAECSRAGVEVHGALVDQALTIRSALDIIMNSAGATWSPASRTFARLWEPA